MSLFFSSSADRVPLNYSSVSCHKVSQVLLITNEKVTDFAVSVKMVLCLVVMMEVLTDSEVFPAAGSAGNVMHQDFMMLLCINVLLKKKRWRTVIFQGQI